ncbi:hypothetical protein N1030_05565 [Desulfovibrio mangrovi]|uniref:hypothetical protein n=1 Tax=Desulfovibrio mangrovi TaxID=2976983 RepID=UPI002248431A|nr:hypothetical protein [Desulfovibrio mangrovi]UZP68443.1 hypothetical protein N1030_05565 [Desulfovibrio mangrovi]
MILRFALMCLVVLCGTSHATTVISRVAADNMANITPKVTAEDCKITCTQNEPGMWKYDVPITEQLLTTVHINTSEQLPPTFAFAPMKLQIPLHEQDSIINIVIHPVIRPQNYANTVRKLYSTSLDPQRITTNQLQCFFQQARTVSHEMLKEHKKGSSTGVVWTMLGVYMFLQSYSQLDNRMYLTPKDEEEIVEAAAWLEKAIEDYPEKATRNLPGNANVKQLLEEVKYAKAKQQKVLWQSIICTQDTAKRHNLLLSYDRMVREAADNSFSKTTYYKQLGIDESHILSALANTMSTLIKEGKYNGDPIPALQRHIDQMIFFSTNMEKNSTMFSMLMSDIHTLKNLKEYLSKKHGMHQN